MDIKWHICFKPAKEPELYNYLLSTGIPVDYDEILSAFDILESDPSWPFIEAYMQNHKLLFLTETIFSKQELAAAEWLSIRSKWQFGYPQPVDDYLYEQITYDGNLICKSCGSNLVQKDHFRLLKTPKWGKRGFGELFWVGDELFVNERTMNCLSREDLSGIAFDVVKNKSGTTVLPDIYQLKIPHILDCGLDIAKTPHKKINVCTHCGTVKYVLNGIGPITMRREVFQNAPDFVKSGDIFGDRLYASRRKIVRQKAYQVIINKHLDRGLVFEPINLI